MNRDGLTFVDQVALDTAENERARLGVVVVGDVDALVEFALERIARLTHARRSTGVTAPSHIRDLGQTAQLPLGNICGGVNRSVVGS